MEFIRLLMRFLWPSSPLGWAFFLAIAGLLGHSLWRLREVRDGFTRLPPECAKVIDDGNPQSAADVEEILTSTRERGFEDRPAILVMFGLLGTFIGVGLGIRQAGAITGPDSSHALAMLLGSLGIKFQTSVWAVTASLALRWALFAWVTTPRATLAQGQWKRIVAMRKEAAKVADDIANFAAVEARETAKARTQAIQDYLSRFEGVLGRMDGCLGGIEAHYGNVVGELGRIRVCLAAADGSRRDHAQSIVRAMEPLKTLTEVASGLNVAAGSVATSAGTMSGAANRLESSLRTLNEEQKTLLLDMAKKFSDGQTTLNSQISTFSKDVNTTLGGVKRTLEGAIQGIERTVGNLDSHLVKHLGELREQQVQFSGDSRKALEDGLRQLAHGSDEQQRFFAQALKDLATQLGAVLDATNRSVGGSAAEIRAAVESSQKALEGTLDAMKNAIESLKDGVAEQLEVFNLYMLNFDSKRAASDQMLQLMQMTVADVAEKAARLKSVAIEQATQETAAKMSILVTTLAAVQQSLKGYLEATDGRRAEGEVKFALMQQHVAEVAHASTRLEFTVIEQAALNTAVGVGTLAGELQEVHEKITTMGLVLAQIGAPVGPGGVVPVVREVSERVAAVEGHVERLAEHLEVLNARGGQWSFVSDADEMTAVREALRETNLHLDALQRVGGEALDAQRDIREALDRLAATVVVPYAVAEADALAPVQETGE